MQERQETLVQYLGLEDPLQDEKDNPLQLFYLDNPMDRRTW